MEMDIEPMVFEVTEIDPKYEFDAPRWCDFTREELVLESRTAELWFQTAQSYPLSPFALKLLEEEASDDKTESSSKTEDLEVTPSVRENEREIWQQPHDIDTDMNTPGNGMQAGIFSSLQGDNLKKVPNYSSCKGPTFSNHIHSDKLKCRTKPSTRPLPRSSTLMRPTASQLAKQDARLRTPVDQIKEKGLFSSFGSDIQAVKKQKLDGGLLRKVAGTEQEIIFFHKKDGTLDRNSQHARKKVTIPQEPEFATSHRGNRIRPMDDAYIDQDSTPIYRFKARPLNRKIFEAPSLPIRKKSTPKLPEFQEFHLLTSERAMQHSSAVATWSYQGNKGSDKCNTTAFLDGVNREPRRPKTMDTPKDDVSDRKRIFKARHLNNKKNSSRGDISIFQKSMQESTVPLEYNLHSEKRDQPDLPTDLLSKLSLTSEQQNNGSCLKFPQPERVKKGSKENRLNSFEARNEKTSKPAPETSELQLTGWRR